MTTNKMQVPGTVDCVYPMPVAPDSLESLFEALTDNVTDVSFTVGAVYVNGSYVNNQQVRVAGEFMNTQGGFWYLNERYQYRLPHGKATGHGFKELVAQLLNYAQGNSGVSVYFTFHEGTGYGHKAVATKTVLLTEDEECLESVMNGLW